MVVRVFTFLAIVIGLVSLGEAAPEKRQRDLLCGVKCLYVGLLSLGVEPGKYADFLEACGEADARGYSIGQLEEVAQKYKVHTMAVQTSLANLQLRGGQFVCIAHVDDDHFVNIGEVSESEVWIVDPPGSGAIAKEVFAKRWDGKALLLSPMPLASENSLGGWPWRMITGIGLGIVAGLWVWKARST